jgi:hypothetical protein
MLAPVVVNPELASKKLSIKDGIAPLITKGSEPKKERSIQPKATMAKPSRAYMLLLPVFKKVRGTPAKPVIKMLRAKAVTSGPW